MSYPHPHPDPNVVEWASWLPWDGDDVPDPLFDLWVKAMEHDGIVDAIMHGEWFCCRELTFGDDVYEVAMHNAADCDICRPLIGPLFVATPPPRRPRCLCLPVWVNNGDGWAVSSTSRFTINPDCPHHGDRSWS